MAASMTNTIWSRRSGNAFEPAFARIDRSRANDLPPLRVALSLVGDRLVDGLARRPSHLNAERDVAPQHDRPARRNTRCRTARRPGLRLRGSTAPIPARNAGGESNASDARITTHTSSDCLTQSRRERRKACICRIPVFTESMTCMCAHTHIRVDGVRDKLSYVYAQKLQLEVPRPTSSAGANAYSAATATAPITGSRPAEATGSNISTRSPR
jgi:hypothetical protein